MENNKYLYCKLKGMEKIDYQDKHCITDQTEKGT
jgi:hypothetical protein